MFEEAANEGKTLKTFRTPDNQTPEEYRVRSGGRLPALCLLRLAPTKCSCLLRPTGMPWGLCAQGKKMGGGQFLLEDVGRNQS